MSPFLPTHRSSTDRVESRLRSLGRLILLTVVYLRLGMPIAHVPPVTTAHMTPRPDRP